MKLFHKKLVSTALVVTMLALTLSACGQDDSAQGNDSTVVGDQGTQEDQGTYEPSTNSAYPIAAEEWGSGTVKYTSEKTADGWTKVTNEGGATLGYTEQTNGISLIQVDGYAFKDLNRSGDLDEYEDWRVDYEARAAAMAQTFSVEKMMAIKMTPMMRESSVNEKVEELLTVGHRVIRAASSGSPIADKVAYHNGMNVFIETLNYDDGTPVLPALFMDDPRSGPRM